MWFYATPAFLFPRAVQGKTCIDPKHIMIILTVLLSPFSALQWPFLLCCLVAADKRMGVSVSQQLQLHSWDKNIHQGHCPTLFGFWLIPGAHVPWIGSRALPAFLFPLVSNHLEMLLVNIECYCDWSTCQFYQLWNIIGIIMDFGLELLRKRLRCPSCSCQSAVLV